MAGNVCASLLLRLRQLISGNLMEPLARTRYCSSYDGIMSYPNWTSSSTCTNEDAILPYPVGIWFYWFNEGPSFNWMGLLSCMLRWEQCSHLTKKTIMSSRQVSLKCSGLGSRAHAERQRWKSKDTWQKMMFCTGAKLYFQSLVMSHWCHTSQKKSTWFQLTQYLATVPCFVAPGYVWRVWIGLKLQLLLSKMCPPLPCFFLVFERKWSFFLTTEHVHAIQDLFSALSSYKRAFLPNRCMNVSNVCVHI